METLGTRLVTAPRTILQHSWCFAKWNKNESKRTREKPLPCTSGCCISIPISSPSKNTRLFQKTTKLSPFTLKCSLFLLYLTPNSNLFSFQCSVSEFKLWNRNDKSGKTPNSYSTRPSVRVHWVACGMCSVPGKLWLAHGPITGLQKQSKR